MAESAARGISLPAAFGLAAVVLMLALAVPPTNGHARPKPRIGGIAQLPDSLAQASARPSTAVVDVPTGIAISGNTAYRAYLELRINFDAASAEHIQMRATIVAQDLTTGLRRTLVSRRSTIIAGLAAGGGRFYALMYRYESIRKERIKMQLVELTGAEAAPRELFSEQVDGRYGDCLPARLTGANAAGEALVVRPYLSSACDFFDEDFTDNSRLVAFGADGSQRELASYVPAFTPVLERGANLVYMRGRRAIIATGGVERAIWDGWYSSIDINSAGDTLIAWSSGDKAEPEDEDELANPPMPPSSVPDPLAPASGILRFPAGSDDAPVAIVDDPDAEISTAMYCGAGVVRFVYRPRRSADFEYSFPAIIEMAVSSEIAMPVLISGAVGVELRDTNGAFVRTLGSFKARYVSQPRCDDGRVVIPYARYVKRVPNQFSKIQEFAVFDAR